MKKLCLLMLLALGGCSGYASHETFEQTPVRATASQTTEGRKTNTFLWSKGGHVYILEQDGDHFKVVGEESK
jgi:hypothetical protein